jgi:hypothetical protein
MPRRRAKRPAPPPSILLPSDSNGIKPKRYEGEKEKLVVAIDIGTTFSAVSYCILRPKCNPQLETVSHLSYTVTYRHHDFSFNTLGVFVAGTGQ